MKFKEILRTFFGTFFRLMPLSVEPGVRIFGNPHKNSPVFVTANFDLTVKRLTQYLKNQDCYLLVAPTNGINVWCAARGSNFTAHSVISVVKTSSINEKVAHRTLILPQLSAPGIDVKLVKRETGWDCKFGPVYAQDIPEYVADGLEKTDKMRRVRWPFTDRIDVGIGISTTFLIFILIIIGFFLKDWLAEVIVLGWGLVFLMYGLHPFIPGKSGWRKILFLEILIVIGVIYFTFPAIDQTKYIQNLFLIAMGLILIIGIDFDGATPLQKSQFDPILDKIGIQKLGNIKFGSRSKIVNSKIVLDQSKCTKCGMCYDICPKGVFEMVEEHKKMLNKYPEKCVTCEACVSQCFTGALTLRV
ncbi:MAG: HgcAB-like fusion protein [Candidatus Bathyarchaeia archaeon]